MSIESTPSVESGVRRQLEIVSALLLLLIGPLFGPIAQVLGNRFEIESAVLLLLVGFIVGFGIILGVIFVNNKFRLATWRQAARSLGLGQPSRLSANVIAVSVGLVWGALFLTSILQFSFSFSLLYGLILAGLFLWGKRCLTPVILAHALPVLIAEPFSSMLIFLAPGA